MNDEITAASFRQAFRGADGLDALALPDAEVVGSVEADVDVLRDALMSAPWLRVEERRGDEEIEGRPCSVCPTDGVQVNFFFGWGVPIEFDFDLREMVDDEAVGGLVRLLRLVCSAVGKDVVARAEGQRDGPPVLHVDAGTGRVVLSPLS